MVLTSLLGLIAILWFVWLPGYRPTLRPGERYGIDVSHHQGGIDWRSVAREGISFAYIKATEGGDFTDSRFAQNWREAAAASLYRGAYHFFTLCTPGRRQANHFLNTVPSDPNTLPPAIDLELSGNCAARPNEDWVHRELESFIRVVEAGTGQTVILYLGTDFEDLYAVRDTFDKPLWRLRLLRRPQDDDWLIWQVMGFGRISGIQGSVDLDVARRSPVWPW